MEKKVYLSSKPDETKVMIRRLGRYLGRVPLR